jgi:ZIP family zinc transporter
MADYTPLTYGFVAGVTVLAGVATLYALGRRASSTALGALQAFAGGILAYISLDVGAEVAEYMEGLAKWETLGLFLADAALTTAVFAGVLLLLSSVERRAVARGMPQSLLTALITALAYGVHNVGEGFAIAGALLSGAAANALLFTVGFAVHNATEGFGIAGPLIGDRKARADLRLLAGLSLLAGLPVMPGAAVYYLGIYSGTFLAALGAAAEASLVYALLHVNLSAMSKLGGVSSPRFWLALTAGVAAAFATESALLLSGL